MDFAVEKVKDYADKSTKLKEDYSGYSKDELVSVLGRNKPMSVESQCAYSILKNDHSCTPDELKGYMQCSE